MTRRRLLLRVETDEEGLRLDRFLALRVPERTRSALRRLLDEGRVDVGGRPAAKPGLRVEPGMEVRLDLPATPELTPRPEPIPLRVVHEDDALLVVDKPAGLVVHAGHGRPDGTLVNALLGRGTPLAPAGGPERPGIVHRLDEGTSGLIVVAKTDAAFHALRADFAGRRVHKRYVALVWGRLRDDEGTVTAGIGRSRVDRLKMSVRAPRRRAAETRFRVLERPPGFTLLEAFPLTGRTHQIRVHLQSLHHPIVGDERYGGRPWRGVTDPRRRAALRGFARLFLHAAGLRLCHPVTGETLRLRARLPDELRGLLDTLRGTGTA